MRTMKNGMSCTFLFLDFSNSSKAHWIVNMNPYSIWSYRQTNYGQAELTEHWRRATINLIHIYWIFCGAWIRTNGAKKEQRPNKQRLLTCTTCRLEFVQEIYYWVWMVFLLERSLEAAASFFFFFFVCSSLLLLLPAEVGKCMRW